METKEAATGQTESIEACLEAARRLLGRRPYSAAELRQRLTRRGFESESVEAALCRLTEQGLIDDVAFARFWAENRLALRPRSIALIRQELRRKGVSTDAIDTAMPSGSDETSAYQEAQAYARHLPLNEGRLFKQRLGEHLRRRGFDYAVTTVTTRRLWRELTGHSPD